MTWEDFLNSPMLVALIPAIVSAIISLVGVVISLRWSASNTKIGLDYALKAYESELSKKVYASSKRLDTEFELFRNLSKHCGQILRLMQQLYPDKLSTLQSTSKFESMRQTLAVEIGDFEHEINLCRAFIPQAITKHYESLLEDAETFYSKAIRHNDCWDDTKSDRARKADLMDDAYYARESFENKWKEVSILVNEHLYKK